MKENKEKTVPQKWSDQTKEKCEKDDESFGFDERWCTFVTKRAQKMTKTERLKQIREKLEGVVNPFSQELVVEVDVRLSPDAKIVDPVYGEVPLATDLEKQKATKVYKTAAYRERTMNLSATAQRMLLFVMYEMTGSDDWVELDPAWYKEASKAGSRNMYKKGKEELVRYGYITKTEQKNVYWVNPAIVFGGNRVAKYPKNVVVKNTFTGKPTAKRKPPTPQDGIRVGKRVKVTVKDGEMNTTEEI